ncbi:riboflavin kinase [Sandarakinorhabdus sp.]|nr:riboflavin kinase [Sandarakinorhabdus sp.]
MQLVAYLRPEMKLNGLDALKAQIAADADAARRMLKGA